MNTSERFQVNRRILVIDDNADIHSDFRKILTATNRRDAGMDAVEADLFGSGAASMPALAHVPEAVFEMDDAYQGQEGLEMVKKAVTEGRPYSLAFVDMRMPPGWDGLETITHLWTADPRLQIVICTAFSDHSWHEIFTRLGDSDRLLIVKKPFDPVEVIQMAHTLTHKWSLASQVDFQIEILEFAVQERTQNLSLTNARLLESINKHEASAKELRRSEERLRSIIDTAHSAIAIVQLDGLVELWNPGAENIFGWFYAEMLGQPLSLVLPEMHNEDMAARLQQLVAQEGNSSDLTTLQLTGRHRDGREVIVEASLAAWHAERGWSISVIMQDISLRKKAEDEILFAKEAAESAAKSKSIFLATMSHEIRTPLNGVIGMSQSLLLADMPPKQREAVEVINRSGLSLLNVLNDILDFSKIEAGKIEVNPSVFNIRSTIHDAVTLYKEQAQKKGISIQIMQSDDCPIFAWADSGRVQQIVLNLLSNAVKFTEKGSVTLSVERGTVCDEYPHGSVVVHVTDSGIGISDSDVSRLFERFSQVDLGNSRRFGGTGLGLAICKQLLELMGGYIRVVSQPGRGSTFSITLPLPAPDVVMVDTSLSGTLDPHADDHIPEGLRVLLVEDDMINKMVVQAMMSEFKVDIEMVDDGQAAFDAWQRDPHRLILMDCQMPVMDGFESTRLIRSAEAVLPHHPHAMIIACTASALVEDRQACTASGMDGFLSKPLTMEALKKTLLNWSRVHGASR